MGLRSYIANALIARGRSIGRSAGLEMKVELSDHSIDVAMADPDREDLAWDGDLYKHGNVFIHGYANPVKPTVNYNEALEDPDTVEVEGSDCEGAQSVAEDAHVELISSPRYRDYMRQDLISQLLNPREQWRLLAYGIIALGILMLPTMILSAAAAGVF